MRRRLSATEDLDGSGGPLGLRSGEKFAASRGRLEEGDRLVFFTDGMTSARNFRGEEFSRSRLAAAVAEGAKLPVSELAASMAEELASFSIGAPRGDDTVLMICEFRSFARPLGSEPTRSSRGEDDYPSLSRKGAFLASSGKVAEAAIVYERLLELEPEDATALSNLGTLYWKMGRRAEAARRFREAARVDPQDPRIARNLALAERSAATAAARGAKARPEGAARKNSASPAPASADAAPTEAPPLAGGPEPAPSEGGSPAMLEDEIADAEPIEEI
jgi:tetratricopeptide (TPR) repeat protein